jgi:EAL domain-containing protein (putative c-di-GMP-specific phosphodiesterase class I)
MADGATFECHEFEALIRVFGGDGFYIPDALTMALDDPKYARTIGLVVLNRAFYQLSIWSSKNIHWSLAINVSSTYMQMPEFSRDLDILLDAYAEVPRELITLELTETAPIHDLDAAKSALQHCRRLGIKIALDDYGSGYSSETHAIEFPIQEIKLDRSFTEQIVCSNDKVSSFVTGVRNMVLSNHFDLVIEGVENHKELDAALALGCTKIQGYYFSYPLQEQELIDWVTDFNRLSSMGHQKHVLVQYA